MTSQPQRKDRRHKPVWVQWTRRLVSRELWRGDRSMAGRVLVVEDEEKNRKLLVDLLTVNGYEVLVAENGREGVDSALRERPDLILMDLRMPVMDGIEAVHILKSDTATSAIPAVAVTASAMVGDEEHVLNAGFDGYIRKPIDVRLFASEVERYLSEVRANGRDATNPGSR